MKKYLIKMIALMAVASVLLSSCSVEYRERHRHDRGYDHHDHDRDHDHHYYNNHR